MNQKFYIPDVPIDGLNTTLVRTGNCISDT